jgi:hypothetical protein
VVREADIDWGRNSDVICHLCPLTVVVLAVLAGSLSSGDNRLNESDGDGDDDIIAASGFRGTNTVKWWENRGRSQ